MPKITKVIEHNLGVAKAIEKTTPAIDEVIESFNGTDVNVNLDENNVLQFNFKSMGFKITGTATVTESNISVVVELPLAAMMFKGRAEKAIEKSINKALE